MMDEYIDQACSIIGGHDPEKFIVPSGMICFIAPPPNGKIAVSCALKRLKTKRVHMGMKNFDSSFMTNMDFNANDVDNNIDCLENYQEGFITNDDFSFIAYIDYWDDLSVMFFKAPIDDIISRKMKLLSVGWKEHLESIFHLSSANKPLISALLGLPQDI